MAQHNSPIHSNTDANHQSQITPIITDSSQTSETLTDAFSSLDLKRNANSDPPPSYSPGTPKEVLTEKTGPEKLEPEKESPKDVDPNSAPSTIADPASSHSKTLYSALSGALAVLAEHHAQRSLARKARHDRRSEKRAGRRECRSIRRGCRKEKREIRREWRHEKREISRDWRTEKKEMKKEIKKRKHEAWNKNGGYGERKNEVERAKARRLQEGKA